MFFLAGIGRAALSGAISGFGYGITIVNPLVGFKKVAVNTAFGAVSGVVALEPKSKMSGLEAAVLGGVVGNIQLPKILLGGLKRRGKTVTSTLLFINHIK